ncbi:MAG: hypothetical protein ACHQUB_02575 [Candidatus Saccharimonadia bacterium]
MTKLQRRILSNLQIAELIKFSLVALWLLIWFVPIGTFADTLLSQGYQSSSQLAIGSIVSLDSNVTGTISAANTGNVDSLIGVVVGANNTPLTLTNGSSNQVQVATSGVVNVLVSDISGTIVTGDPVTASPIDGVGMKATSNIKVIGVAQGDLATSVGKTTQTFTDQNGQKQQAQLGVIPVLVNVAYYFKQPSKTLIPNVIQNIANTIANRVVSPLPILVSLGIFLVTVISIMILIYAAIRSSIISVGRNPLSQAAVYRSLLQVSALVLSIVGVAIGTIYLILTKL